MLQLTPWQQQDILGSLEKKLLGLLGDQEPDKGEARTGEGHLTSADRRKRRHMGPKGISSPQEGTGSVTGEGGPSHHKKKPRCDNHQAATKADDWCEQPMAYVVDDSDNVLSYVSEGVGQVGQVLCVSGGHLANVSAFALPDPA